MRDIGLLDQNGIGPHGATITVDCWIFGMSVTYVSTGHDTDDAAVARVKKFAIEAGYEPPAWWEFRRRRKEQPALFPAKDEVQR